MGDKLTDEHATSESVLTAAELKVLEPVRQEEFSKVTIHKRQGKILNIETEEDIPPSDLDDKTGAVIVRNMADYESVTLSKHQGKTVKARRTRPMPLTEQENRTAESSRSGVDKTKL